MVESKASMSSCSCCPGEGVEIAPSCCCPGIEDKSQEIIPTTSTLRCREYWDHFLARWGIKRMGHCVLPGLYRLGEPTPDSPVLASANYTLSFDALRSALSGKDAYILVLDTRGINVWCAAGKGTFGTDELVRRISITGLGSVVRHRTIILPQLGAPGVAAHEVLRQSGFRVDYGPVLARDLPTYLENGKATPDMRRVGFPFRDRMVLTPVELVHAAPPAILAAVALYFLIGPLAAIAAITTVLAGTVLFPALLPIIPTHDFSTRGFILGAIVAIPFAAVFTGQYAFPLWADALGVFAILLLMGVATAYLALNFTGCTPFTSRTGVKTEIFRYVPAMLAMAITGIILVILLGVLRFMEVI